LSQRIAVTIERLFDRGKLDTLLVVTNIYIDGFLVGIVPGEKTTEVQSQNDWIKTRS
jgi:hypothetical protein